MENTNVHSGFNIVLKSDLPYFDTSSMPQGAINLFRYRVNLFDMFPVAELNWQDSVGASAENGLPESLDINLELIDFDENINKKIALTLKETQQEKDRNQDYVHGQFILDLISKYYRKSLPKKKSYKDKVSNIVKQVLKEDFGLKDSQMFVYPTSDTNTYHVRGNLNTQQFLINLKNQAFTSDYPNSPFLCFFDFYQKFYFAPMEYFFNQTPVMTLSIKKTTDAGTIAELMKTYRLYSGDLDSNLYRYKSKVGKIDKSGEYVQEDIKLATFLPKSSKSDKFYVISNFIEKSNFNNDEYSLMDSNENYLFKGRLNSKYINSLLTHRIEFITNFDFKLDIGKMITIDMPKLDEGYSTFQSGNYLVMDYSFFYTNTGRIPYVSILVAKAGKSIEKNNYFNGKTI